MFDFIFGLPKEMFVVAMLSGLAIVMVVFAVAMYRMKSAVRKEYAKVVEASPFK